MPVILAQVALPVPLDQFFTYVVPPHLSPKIGCRVAVSFGRQKLTGIVVGFPTKADFPIEKIKPIIECLDDEPIWPKPLYQLLTWCSQFYQYPLGDTFGIALPALLRKGKPSHYATLTQWTITQKGKQKIQEGFGQARAQKKAVLLVTDAPVMDKVFTDEKVSRATLKILQENEWIKSNEILPQYKSWTQTITTIENTEHKPNLNEEQAIAVATINNSNGFGCYLLDGVTGSGKTEVYLNLIKPVLDRKQQALILVPEIGLTPQLINRIKRRFNVPVDVMHSGLNDTERLNAWLAARENHAGIIIGTRSSLFTPFADLGIIIVDEEHDASFKQQDTLRYHARDVAIMRANKENIPIVLGSATPALESIHNAKVGKYHYLSLSKRAGNAQAATHKILDIKGLHLEGGLSAPLIAEMRRHLNDGNQVMLFLNRRGFSPALMCHECGWMAECQRCDAYYTFHQGSREMRCHHCGSQRPVVPQCQGCGSTQMVSVGVGTEQLESQLEMLFPEFKTIRIDRDSTRRKGSLETALKAVRNGEFQILIGTQMLAKGHHFPDVTLVGLIDVDGSLYSSDFRAPERLAQLFIQVAGRAGRASKKGEVLLQTHHPEHMLLQSLLHKDYQYFAEQALNERKLAQLPPFVHLTLFRAEGNHSNMVEDFLRQIRQTLEVHPLFDDTCMVLGPMPAPLAKRAGKYRWQLLLQVSMRSQMHKLLSSAKPVIQLLPLSQKVRWSMDIEPQDFS